MDDAAEDASIERSGPVWTIGRCGSIAAHCSSLSQKLSATIKPS
jgi:hypothetical protein